MDDIYSSGVYSIGETAKINDISIKSLRHYDDIGLLKPKYIDNNNGYRYYTYDQFSFIDKIKRYKNIGMSLKDLKEVFQTQNLQLIEDFLKLQKKNLEQERLRLEEMKQDVDWLTEFFEYSKKLVVGNSIFTKHIEERKFISVPCDGDDSIYSMDMELRRIISQPVFKNVQILNPYGYILDFDNLMQNKFYPNHSTVCIRDSGEINSQYICTVPAGNYICCHCKVISGSFDISPLIEYCKKNNIMPKLTLACEYLNSLYDPANSPYEIQILY